MYVTHIGLEKLIEKFLKIHYVETFGNNNDNSLHIMLVVCIL